MSCLAMSWKDSTSTKASKSKRTEVLKLQHTMHQARAVLVEQTLSVHPHYPYRPAVKRKCV